jgi:hypothetical protein
VTIYQKASLALATGLTLAVSTGAALAASPEPYNTAARNSPIAFIDSGVGDLKLQQMKAECDNFSLHITSTERDGYYYTRTESSANVRKA